MMALPPLPDLAVTLLPALPPSPPTAVTFTAFTALPVSPDTAPEADVAPELAADTATPTALASPVEPEFPLSPDRASAFTVALPLMAVLLADRLTWTSPVLPVEPESPEVAIGFDSDVDDAAPVLPVLVADDWATTAPESPDVASGSMCRATEPPSPPLADATAMESPPTALFAACAGGAATASRLMPPISPASTQNRDLRRISSLPPVAPL